MKPEVFSEIRYKLKADTPLRWTQINPILLEGEPGLEKGTNRLKIGDGDTPWNDLPYFGSGASNLPDDSALSAHILDSTPHPVYDDGPSLFLLYENAKV